MDLLHRPQDDFTSVRGFILSVRDTMRVKRGGLLWCGHPCNPLLVNKRQCSGFMNLLGNV